MTHDLKVEYTGGSEYDKNKVKTSAKPKKTKPENVVDEYQAFVDKRNREFEEFKNRRNAEFEAFVQKSNAEFEKYKNGKNDIQDFTMVVPAQIEYSVTTGLPIEKIPHYEMDENGNPVNNYYDANGKLIKSVPEKAPDSSQLQTIQPKVSEDTATEKSSAQERIKADEDKIHMSDFISGISDETVSYLKNDKKFTETSDEFVNFEYLIANDKKNLKKEIDNLKNAKTKFEQTPYQDFDEKQKAHNTYFDLRCKVQQLQFDIRNKEHEQGVLMSAMKSYASTIENWEDGQTHHLRTEIFGYGEIDGIYDREYKSVTLPNGHKAYEYNGEYYELSFDGKPSLFDKVE